MADIESGSITPRTHVERLFRTSLDDAIFVDSLKSPIGVEVKRVAINTRSLIEGASAREKKDTDESGVASIILEEGERATGGSIDAVVTPLSSPSDCAVVTPATGRSDAASSRRSADSRSTRVEKLKEVAANVKHLDVEKDAVRMAVEHLISKDAERTVLVDILERDTSTGEVNRELKTHTVVLYKNPIKEDGSSTVFVIDPSNSEFSLHLSNADIRSILPENVKIITDYNKKSIYKVPDGAETSFSRDGFRDCMDVAVKIAFYLERHDIFYTDARDGVASATSFGAGSSSDSGVLELHSYPDLYKLEPILALQRGGGITKLWYDGYDYSIRVRQSSDPRVSSGFSTISGSIDTMMNIASITSMPVFGIANSSLSTLAMHDASCIRTLASISTLLSSEISRTFNERSDMDNETARTLIGLTTISYYGGEE